MNGRDTWFQWTAWAWLGFLAYQLCGTLRPDFTRELTFDSFLAVAPGGGHLRDWLENFLLALPGGALFGLADGIRRQPQPRAFARYLLLFALLALALEGAQTWVPPRVASFWDAVLLGAGAGAGYIIAVLLAEHAPLRAWLASGGTRQGWATGAGLVWIASFAQPIRLELDPHMLRNSLLPLLQPPPFSFGTLLWAGAGWLGAFHLLRASLRTAALALAGAMVLLWLAPGRALCWEILLGGGVALAACRAFQTPASAPILAAIVFAGAAVKALGLAPTHDIAVPVLFSADPALFERPALLVLLVLIQHYLPLVMSALVVAATPKPALASALLAGAWIVTELSRLASDGASPRVSALVALIIAVATALQARRQSFACERETSAAEPLAARRSRRHQPRSEPNARKPWFAFRFWRALAGAAGLTVVIAGLARLPQMPYNVRELFESRHALLGPVLLALFLLWSCAAPLPAARFTLRRANRHLLQVLIYLGMAIPAWLCLRFAVSAESLWDILGNPVLGWPSDWELFMRFLAFAAPAMLFLMYWYLFWESRASGRTATYAAAQLLVAVCAGAPLLVLVKYIVVDQAATDNVRELIVGFGAWHGVIYVLATIALIAFNGTALAALRAQRQGLWLLALSPVLGMFAWFLLRRGLEPIAIAFLLSPARESALSTLALTLRWEGCYLALVALIAGAGSCFPPTGRTAPATGPRIAE